MLDKANEELVIKKGWLFVTLLKLRISSGEGGDFSSPFKSIGIPEWSATLRTTTIYLLSVDNVLNKNKYLLRNLKV